MGADAIAGTTGKYIATGTAHAEPSFRLLCLGVINRRSPPLDASVLQPGYVLKTEGLGKGHSVEDAQLSIQIIATSPDRSIRRANAFIGGRSAFYRWHGRKSVQTQGKRTQDPRFASHACSEDFDAPLDVSALLCNKFPHRNRQKEEFVPSFVASHVTCHHGHSHMGAAASSVVVA